MIPADPKLYRCEVCGTPLLPGYSTTWRHRRTVSGPYGQRIREECRGEFRPIDAKATA